MTIRKWVGLFFKTLLIGAIVALITSYFVETKLYNGIFSNLEYKGILGTTLFFVGYGLTFSAISQMGFFAYLFVHQFGLGFFKRYWPTVQIALIAFVLFDFVYFTYNHVNGEISVWLFIAIAAGMLIYGIIIASLKVKATNPHGFIPTLFVIIVITTVEWIPGLRVFGSGYEWIIVTTLLACNTYQVLVLHKLTGAKSK